MLLDFWVCFICPSLTPYLYDASMPFDAEHHGVGCCPTVSQKNACAGGSDIDKVDDYCTTGYEGVGEPWDIKEEIDSVYLGPFVERTRFQCRSVSRTRSYKACAYVVLKVQPYKTRSHLSNCLCCTGVEIRCLAMTQSRRPRRNRSDVLSRSVINYVRCLTRLLQPCVSR